MYYRDVRCPSEDEQRLIDIATHIAGIAIARNRAEQTQKRQKDFLDKLIRHLPLAVFVKNARNEFRYELVNRKAGDLLGLMDGEVLGRHDFEIHRRELAEFFAPRMRRPLPAACRSTFPTSRTNLRALTPCGCTRSKFRCLTSVEIPATCWGSPRILPIESEPSRRFATRSIAIGCCLSEISRASFAPRRRERSSIATARLPGSSATSREKKCSPATPSISTSI